MFEKAINDRVKKVFDFYRSLPQEMKESILAAFCNDDKRGSREDRRAFEKKKSTDDKIIYALQHMREPFANAAYETCKDKIDLSLQSAKYEDIIENINDENKSLYTIFFFRWCYEDGAAGTSNDKNYFDLFTDSTLLSAILKGSPITEDVKRDAFNTKDGVEASETVKDIDQDEQEITQNEEDISMEKTAYIGRIELRGTYFNFFPQFVLKNDLVQELNGVVEKFPTKGGINLGCLSPYSQEYKFIEQKLQYINENDRYVKAVSIVEFDENDLSENRNSTNVLNSDYQLKLDLKKVFIDNGGSLEDVFHSPDEYHIYKIVTGELSKLSNEDWLNGSIFLNEDNNYIVEGEKVVLLYENKYFGPFKVNYRQIDGKFYIKANANNEISDCLVPYFSTDSVLIMSFEKQVWDENPRETNYVQLKGEKQFLDVIADDYLLSKAAEEISLEDAKKDPNEFVNMCSASPFFAKIPAEIKKSRIEKLQSIADDVNSFNDARRKFVDIILSQHEDVILQSKEYTELKINYNDLTDQYESVKNTNKELEKKLGLSKENKTDSIPSEKLREKEEEIENYKKEIEDLKARLEQYQSKEEIKKSIEQLEKDKKQIQDDNDTLTRERERYKSQVNDAKLGVEKAIKEATSSGAEVAFDPFISNQLIKAASQWAQGEERNNLNKIFENTKTVECSPLCGDKLVDKIVEYVQSLRDYTPNAILNIYISVAQNFITVFSGEPGTGKTSMCNIIATSLGLTGADSKINRFVTVPVERGWSSKRDLIGYFNPLTGKYDRSSNKIYDALRMLDVERENSRFPYLIMLDEANLSPMEYYWSDFMGIADLNDDRERSLDIGLENIIMIPDTLRFLATINNDQTTEPLSPRMIDRACIIKLPSDVKIISHNTDVTPPGSPISWENFTAVFDNHTVGLSDETKKRLNKLYNLFGKYGMAVSPRIKQVIENYIETAQTIMYDESGAAKTAVAMDYAVMQKLLPKINGASSNYTQFFDEMKQNCTEYQMNMTKEAIEKMQEDTVRNMDYCQYLT